jgi:hypothetical protein
MQCERVPNDHLPECGQQNLGSECVLLIEGKVVRRLLGRRTMIQQNLGNVQPGKMYSDTCVAESPKPVAKPFERVADHGSATLYVLMEVATSAGTALRAVIATTIVAY